MLRRPPITQTLAISAICAAILPAAACQHIKGVVIDQRAKPIPTAVFSIGRPDAIAVFGTHKVDARGQFDFQLSPADATNVYVYDGAGDPQETLYHLDQSELSDHMRIVMRRATAGPPEDYLKVPQGFMNP